MAEDELEIPDLIAYALFEADERASQFSLPLQMFLVSLALFETGGSLGSQELFQAVCSLLPAPDIDRESFVATISKGVDVGLIKRDDIGQFSLTEDRLKELEDASERLDFQRKAFHTHIRASVERELDQVLSEEESENLSEELERYLQRFFQDQSVVLAKAFGATGKGFDASMDGLQERRLATLVNLLVPSTKKLRRNQYHVGLRDGLLSLDESGHSHMATLYQKTVAFALLHQDPTVHRVKRRLAQQRIIYLDTNVLMAWMFESHREHALAREVIELANSVKCTLLVSKFTLDELNLQLSESNDKYLRLAHHGSILEFIDDDVMRSYHRGKEKTPNMPWGVFLANFQPPQAWLKDHGVECDSHQDWANAVQDDRKEKVFSTVRANKKSWSPVQLIEFDVHNIIYIHLRRKRWSADAMGNRVWLVTLDRSLGRAEASLVKQRIYAVPASHDARAWCEFLGPYAIPDSPELEDYVTHLVHSRLGLLHEDPKFVDANFLMTLEESGLDIESLLKAGPARARQVLVRLQENREVRRLLQVSEDGRQEPAWDSRLQEAVGKALSEMDPDPKVQDDLTDARRQRDQAMQVADSAKRERDRALRRLSELEKDHQNLETRIRKIESERDEIHEGILRRVLKRLANG